MAGPLLRALYVLTFLFFSTNHKKLIKEETKRKREISNVPCYAQRVVGLPRIGV